MMNDSIRILLVDDEPRFCESLAQILHLSGHLVTSAQSGNEAVELLVKNVFDLLLLDVELPDMLGYQIMDSLKDENFGAATIMLTGHATVETAIEALKKGAYDYLEKPLDHDLLFKTIDKALQHSRLEKELRSSEERARTLAEASWEGLAVHSNGQLLDANRQFFDMFGYQADELLGKQILDNNNSIVSIPEVSLRIKNETYESYEAIGVKKDGTEFPIETSSRHMQYQGKEVRVCAVRDITERVKAEQEKLELQKQLAIASKMETLGLMAGSVAHDLNNILSGIVTLPELLLIQMGNDHEHSETIRIIQEAGKEAASVVSDLITVTRGAIAEKRICNLNTLIEKYMVNIKGKKVDPRLEGITVEFNCEPELSNNYCSVVHINKVLMNLIGNAAEEMEGKGTVMVSTKNISLEQPFSGYETIEVGDYVVVSVTDDGSGIIQEDVKKIFEPFYSKKSMGRSGTGLGLAIVWNTVHDHGGFVDVKSDGNGTTFDLYFPVTKDVVEEDRELPFIEKYRGVGEKILVVDDQKRQQEIASNLLGSLGYKTDVVGSGEEAVAYIKLHSVDLVILDMIMNSGINGRETYEEILKISPKQRALIASGFAENEEVKQTLHLGASQFISKPYTLFQMGLAVKQALSQE
jgi:two-component system, cell cycle sensor histidine kinase and response regulator CckA